MEFIGDLGASAVLSSHALSDVERVCDYLIVMADSRIQVAGDVLAQLLQNHYRLTVSRNELNSLPQGLDVVHADHAFRGSALVIRSDGPPPVGLWQVENISLEDLVLAYMTRANLPAARPGSMAQEARR